MFAFEILGDSGGMTKGIHSQIAPILAEGRPGDPTRHPPANRRADPPSMRATGPSMMPDELDVGPDPQATAGLEAYEPTPRPIISGSSFL